MSGNEVHAICRKKPSCPRQYLLLDEIRAFSIDANMCHTATHLEEVAEHEAIADNTTGHQDRYKAG